MVSRNITGEKSLFRNGVISMAQSDTATLLKLAHNDFCATKGIYAQIITARNRCLTAHKGFYAS